MFVKMFLKTLLISFLIAVVSCSPIAKPGYIAPAPIVHAAPLPVVAAVPASYSHSSVIHHASPVVVRTAPIVPIVHPIHHPAPIYAAHHPAPIYSAHHPVAPVIVKTVPAYHPAPLVVKSPIVPALHPAPLIVH